MSRKPCPYRKEHDFDTEGLCVHCFTPAFPKVISPPVTAWESLPLPPPWWQGWSAVGLLLPAPGGWREVPSRVAAGSITGYARAIVGPGGWEYRADAGLLINRVAIRFPPPRCAWGFVEAVALYKADGTQVTTIALTQSKMLQPGDVARFDKGTLAWELKA